jgi:hypothetical protein
LRHRHAEDAVIDHRHRDLAAGKFLLGDVRREFETVEVRERTLPAGERRSPVTAVGNVGVDQYKSPADATITGLHAEWDRILWRLTRASGGSRHP